MPISLSSRQSPMYLKPENRIVFDAQLPDFAEEVCEAYLELENEEVCDIVKGVQRLAKTKSSFMAKVRFKQIGQLDLGITGQLRYRDHAGVRSTPKEVEGSLEFEVLSPFDREENLRPLYILARDVGLTDWMDRETQPVFWMYGLPMVGKTTLVHNWADEVGALYLDVSRRDISEHTWYSWASEKIRRDTKGDCPSKSDSELESSPLVDDAQLFWLDLKRWCREKDGRAVLALDQAEIAFEADGPSFVQFLIDILRIREDLQGSTEELRLVVVDTCLEVRKMAREKIRNVDNLLHPKEIGPFSNEELRNYIEESPVPRNLLLGVMSEHLSDELIECLLKLTGGYPAFVNAYLCPRGFYAEYPFSGDKDSLRKDIFSIIKETRDSEYLKRVSTKFWKMCLRYDVLQACHVENIVGHAEICQGRCLKDENIHSLQCRYPSSKSYHSKEIDFCPFNPWIMRVASGEEL